MNPTKTLRFSYILSVWSLKKLEYFAVKFNIFEFSVDDRNCRMLIAICEEVFMNRPIAQLIVLAF